MAAMLITLGFLLASAVPAFAKEDARNVIATLTVQVAPYPFLSLTAESGRTVLFLPFSSVRARDLRPLAQVVAPHSTQDVRILVVYAIPDQQTAAKWRNALLSIRQKMRCNRLLTVYQTPVRQPEDRQLTAVSSHKMYALASDFTLSLHPLPSADGGLHVHTSLLRVSYRSFAIGILLPAQMDPHPWPDDPDILLLQPSLFPRARDQKPLDVLDPSARIVLDEGSPKDAETGALIERLREHWGDVYRVTKRNPLVLTIDRHHLILPMSRSQMVHS